MSKAKMCVRGILGDAAEITDENIDAVIRDLKKRQRQIKAYNRGLDAEAEFISAADEVIADIDISKQVERRNAYLNILAHRRGTEYISRFNNDATGIEALVVGSQKRIKGARLSADAAQKARAARYLGGFTSDLRREGVLEYVRPRLFGFGKGPLDDKIAVELWELRDGGSPGSTKSPEAKKIADIIHKYQELARRDQNRYGAFIRKMPGYIVSQSHDMLRMRRAGRDQWIADVLPLLDERTFEGDDPRKFLESVYNNLITGSHIKVGDRPEFLGFKGPGNLGKKVSAQRVLHFRDGMAWVAYNDKYGRGSLMEGVSTGLHRAARAVGIMETLGPNPRAMMERLQQDALLKAQQAGDTKQADLLRNKRLSTFMDAVDGSLDIPGDIRGAHIGASVRALQSTAKLGGAVLSSVPDVMLAAAELRYQGDNMFSALGKQLSGFLEVQTTKAGAREVADLIGAGAESMMGDIQARITGADSLPGVAHKMQTAFFKLNLLTWWTDSHERALSAIMSRNLRQSADKAFGSLSAEMRNVLGLYDIGAEQWDLIRRYGRYKAQDGSEWITIDGLKDIPDSAFPGMKPAQARAARDRLMESLQAYFTDRTSHGVLKGGAKEKALLTGGTQAGTAVGEAMRFVMQFKSYSVSFVTKVLGRFAQEDRFWQVFPALRHMPKSEMAQFAGFLVGLTALGYVAMAAKDLAKGRTPRDPNKPETWLAAFVQGGGAGIYGDFLFGQASRFGQSPLETFAGPVPGTAADLVNIFLKTRDYATGLSDDAPDSEFFQLFKNNTPFLNLFYTRAALDYLVLYEMQEAIAPGSLRRMERRLEKENGQRFLVPPSEVVN